MSHPAILASQISKSYRLGSARHDTMRDWLSDRMRWRRSPSDLARDESRQLWALRDVSFEIQPSDVVGIIGRNGAGKSTLLKILTRITKPTSGRLSGWGRVGSLLEVGTGFHPELSGRENIFLSGAVLGMSRRELIRKFSQIVEFSEIGPFLDTPVKRYSSGMYVRLGFAVAAHLEPDILVIDEVLAVGDSAFQRKCLEFMQGLAREGRTILFVSHNLSTVLHFCRSALLLQRGQLTAHGSTQEVIRHYTQSLETSSQQPLRQRTDRSGQGPVRLVDIRIAHGQQTTLPLSTGQPTDFEFELNQLMPGLSCSFTIYDAAGTPITFFDSNHPAEDDRTLALDGPPVIRCRVGELALLPGRYRINAACYVHRQLHDHLEGAAFFDVEPNVWRGRRMPDEPGGGRVVMAHSWTIPPS